MDALLRPQQVALLLAVHPSTLSRLRTAGLGPPVVWVTEKSPRYLLTDVEAWLRARKGGK